MLKVVGYIREGLVKIIDISVNLHISARDCQVAIGSVRGDNATSFIEGSYNKH